MKAIHKILDFEEEKEETQAQVKATIDCPICSETFESKSSLGRHRSNVHKGQTFVCRTCGRRFNGFKHLLKHYPRLHDKIVDAKTAYTECLETISNLH